MLKRKCSTTNKKWFPRTLLLLILVFANWNDINYGLAKLDLLPSPTFFTPMSRRSCMSQRNLDCFGKSTAVVVAVLRTLPRAWAWRSSALTSAPVGTLTSWSIKKPLRSGSEMRCPMRSSLHLSASCGHRCRIWLLNLKNSNGVFNKIDNGTMMCTWSLSEMSFCFKSMRVDTVTWSNPATPSRGGLLPSRSCLDTKPCLISAPTAAAAWMWMVNGDW